MIAAHIRALWHKAWKLLRLLSNPTYRHALRHGVAAAVEHEVILSRIEAATVLDVGANRGQFALTVRRCLPKASVLSFEPLADARSAFEKLFAGDSAVEIFAMALGATNGSATLYRSQRDDSSSLLPIGPLQSKTFPGTHEVGRENVPVARLETALASRTLTQPVLCKIDVQGGELDVLTGFGQLAATIDLIMIELSFVDFYTGQPLFPAVDACLRDMGFRMDCMYGATLDRDGTVLQCNALYRRLPSSPAPSSPAPSSPAR